MNYMQLLRKSVINRIYKSSIRSIDQIKIEFGSKLNNVVLDFI